MHEIRSFRSVHIVEESELNLRGGDDRTDKDASFLIRKSGPVNFLEGFYGRRYDFDIIIRGNVELDGEGVAVLSSVGLERVRVYEGRYGGTAASLLPEFRSAIHSESAYGLFESCVSGDFCTERSGGSDILFSGGEAVNG